MIEARKTETGNISVLKDGNEIARVCKFPAGWQVLPVASQRSPSRKFWPDPTAAARSYYKADIARLVAAAATA